MNPRNRQATPPEDLATREIRREIRKAHRMDDEEVAAPGGPHGPAATAGRRGARAQLPVIDRVLSHSRRPRPRVLLMMENLPLARDRRLQKQVQTLADAGYNVTVICRKGEGNRSVAGIDIVEYPAPRDAASKVGYIREYGYSWAMAALSFLRVAVRPGFDAVQLCAPPDIYFPFALLARALGKPAVYDQRDPSPELYAERYGRDQGPVYRLLQVLEFLSYRSAHHVVTANGSFREIACGRGRVAPEKVTVIGNGPVLATTQARPARPELRQGRAHLCCWIGAMGPQDHVDLGIRAVHHLVHRQGRTDCHFAFVGEGETRAEAMRLAAELDVEDWVSFPGFLSQEDTFAYLATADVGMDPGLDDTVAPVKTIEYMAFALPFVAFDLRELRAMAGDAALYAPSEDVVGFAERIGDLLDDAALRRHLGRVGRRRVEQCLAWDHDAPSYVAVFDRLLRARRRPVERWLLPFRPRTGRAAPPVRGRPPMANAG